MSWVIKASVAIGQMVTLSPKGQQKWGAPPEGTVGQVRKLHEPPIKGISELLPPETLDCIVRWKFPDKTIRDISHSFDELEPTS